MKAFTVAQAKPQLGKLVERAHRGRPVVLVHKNKLAQIAPFEPLDPEYDSPDLEAMLLKAVTGPHTPYSRKDLEEVAENIRRK